MNRVLQYFVILVLLIGIVTSGQSSTQMIVLTQENTQEAILQELHNYQNLSSENPILKKIQNEKTIVVTTEKLSNQYILKVGPFSSSKRLTIAYIALRDIFPKAFILEDTHNIQPTHVKTQYKEIIVEREDPLLWTAIFLLAITGIFALFFSSNQIRSIKRKHTIIQEKQGKLELFLTNIGENIYSLTKQTLGVRTNKSDDVETEEQLPKKNSIENKLFDETKMMIHFLRLKSKKVKIIEESFNLNTMLNGILGTLKSNFKNCKIEVIFDIENSVPRELLGDPVHLAEILTELLQNALQYTVKGQVKLHISTQSNFGKQEKLKFEVSDTGIGISQKQLSMLFIPSYTEDGKYKGIGLYVANELSSLMRGTLTIEKSNEEGSIFVCTIPLLKKPKDDRRQYRLPDLSFTKKKVLIYSFNNDATVAIEKMLGYFKLNTKIISPTTAELESIDLSTYDMIFLEVKFLDEKDIQILKSVRESRSLKVIDLHSAFLSVENKNYDLVDTLLEKPINQERLYELINFLFDENKIKQNKIDKERKLPIVVHPEDMMETAYVTTDSFHDFQDKKVLIVEDNFIDQRVLKSILNKAGVQISIANNGKEALEILDEESNSIDLILMDISMPIMDGYETIDAIRKDTNYDTIPVVALTSLALDSDIDKMFYIGANAYLGKPMKMGYLYTVFKLFLNPQQDITEPSEKDEKDGAKENVDTSSGLNTVRGIEHANGSEALYNEVLDEFLSAYGNSDETLQRMVDENRLEQVKRLCLDMKGLTAAIGAEDMFEIVDAMHKQFLYNTVHLIPKFVETYQNGLHKLNLAIKSYRDKS